MPDSPRTQREIALRHVEALIRRGQELHESADAGATGRVDDLRAWQQQCAAAIHHLSGGSKAHWLSRAFSDAFLVRSIDGAAVVHAPAEEIARRLLDVLSQARASLLQMGDITLAPFAGERDEAAGPPPSPQRFGFVHRRELQPILERTFADSRDAFDGGDFGRALVLACGVLEAIITDALEHAVPRGESDDAIARLAEMPFDARIAAAERAGLIRGGCARLPPTALSYRDLLDDAGALRYDAIVIARDARLAAQVLRIVMRDLDPGR
jgi:hypothetical protein